MTVRSIAILGILSVTACLSHRYLNLSPLPAGTVLCANSAQLNRRAPFVADLQLHDTTRAPDLEDYIAVERAGGHVLHAFTTPVIRVRVDGGGLQTLLRGAPPLADAAYVVTDTASRAPAAGLVVGRPPCS